jgi:hypothetical protein
MATVGNREKCEHLKGMRTRVNERVDHLQDPDITNFELEAQDITPEVCFHCLIHCHVGIIRKLQAESSESGGIEQGTPLRWTFSIEEKTGVVPIDIRK